MVQCTDKMIFNYSNAICSQSPYYTRYTIINNDYLIHNVVTRVCAMLERCVNISLCAYSMIFIAWYPALYL